MCHWLSTLLDLQMSKWTDHNVPSSTQVSTITFVAADDVLVIIKTSINAVTNMAVHHI